MNEAVVDEDLGILRYLIHNEHHLCDQVDQYNHTSLSLAIKEEKYNAAKNLIFGKCDINLGGGTYGSCLSLSVLKI